ncbi:unnamed protein product [Caenorhabditis sp. 36 PRJEB53466]|nr:unnamed protein product [Caenorhabditis sp. 36 PRJEB53466]
MGGAWGNYPKMPTKVVLEFEAGESCTCLFNGVAYDAKVQEIKDADTPNPKYVIHFKGWNTRYDEALPADKASERLFKGSAADYVKNNGGKLPGLKMNRRPKAPEEQPPGAESREDSPVASTSKTTKSVKRSAFPVAILDEKDLNIELPKPLRRLLVDDYDLISRNFNLRVPAEWTIDRIVADYIKTIPVTHEQLKSIDELYVEYDNADQKVTNVALICTARGLCDYFNVILGYQLLYKFERNQYNDLVQAEAASKGLKRGNVATLPEHGFRASAHYGLIHLVRMIARLPKLLNLTQWNDHLINRIMGGVHDFVVFLNKNHRQYFAFADEYQSATSEYYRRAVTADDELGPIA